MCKRRITLPQWTTHRWSATGTDLGQNAGWKCEIQEHQVEWISLTWKKSPKIQFKRVTVSSRHLIRCRVSKILWDKIKFARNLQQLWAVSRKIQSCGKCCLMPNVTQSLAAEKRSGFLIKICGAMVNGDLILLLQRSAAAKYNSQNAELRTQLSMK